ncbi:3'-5' exonuclease [Lacipirellula sp.]|uniref:3'-5' exonuclease n=1 Tax=Lacipirellula sp. TaxID=2691419 RepID=UPI003D10BA13
MNQKLVFIDLEVGGPNPKRHPIIQLGAIAVDSRLEVLEAFEAKIRFNHRSANAYSLRKNSYHPGIWATEACEPKAVAKEFAQFLRRHATAATISNKGDSYQVAQLVAHNAHFDGSFLIDWYERLGVYLPAKRQLLCTLQLALWRCVTSGENPPANFQLATLCAHFGVPLHAAKAHDALSDVTATVQLFRALAPAVDLSPRRPGYV